MTQLPVVPGLTLTRLLGSGCTGQVYAAHRDLDGWQCAVKVVHENGDGGQADRLLREAMVLGHLRLPHLVHLHDVVRTTDGRPALVLDLVEGGTVAGMLQQRGRVSAGEMVTVIGPVLATLGALHERGIVHGDVSAGNVLLGVDGRPMLGDLAGSRLVGERHPQVDGTQGYVAPEVVDGGQPSAAADVYAAGALAWRLLTGQPPGPGLTRPDLVEVCPQLPEAVVALVDECLAADPRRRPPAGEAAQRFLVSTPARAVEPAGGLGPGEELTRRIRSEAGLLLAPGAVRGRHRPHPGQPRVAPSGSGGRGSRAPTLAVVAAALVAAGSLLVITGVWRPPGAHGPVTMDPGGRQLPVSAIGQVPDASASPLPRGAGDQALRPSQTSGPPGRPTGGVGTGPPGRPSGGVGPGPPGRPSGGVSPGLPGSEAAPDVPAREFTRLVDARARAFRAGDPRLLEAVYLPGSAGWLRDREALRRMRGATVRFEGLTYRVLEVSEVGRRPDRRWLRTRVATSSYQIVDRAGERRHRPERQGSVLVVELRRWQGQWRIASTSGV